MTPLPPTFTEETKREFDAKYKSAIQPPGEDCRAVKELKYFLLSRESAAYDLGDKNGYERGIVEESQNCWEHSEKAKAEGRAETLKEVREMCEGMMIPGIQGLGGNELEDIHTQLCRARNAALSDLITRLTQ